MQEIKDQTLNYTIQLIKQSTDFIIPFPFHPSLQVVTRSDKGEQAVTSRARRTNRFGFTLQRKPNNTVRFRVPDSPSFPPFPLDFDPRFANACTPYYMPQRTPGPSLCRGHT